MGEAEKKFAEKSGNAAPVAGTATGPGRRTPWRFEERGRKPRVRSAQVAEFVGKWQGFAEELATALEKSGNRRWAPEWVYERSPQAIAKRGVAPFRVVRFAEIADERTLARLSRICERQWLRYLEDGRAAWVAEAAKRGENAGSASLGYERHLCKESLYYLGKFVLGYDRLTFHLHFGMAATMERLPDGYRGLREFPRDSYKSTVLVITFMVQAVLRNPEVTILLKSNKDENASKKVSEAKGHFFGAEAGSPNRLLPRLFPELRPIKQAQQGSDSFWRCPAAKRSQQEGTYEAAGVGASKTSQHYDMILGDDFWDQKSVTSREMTAKVNKELDEIEYLLAEPRTGKIVFVGTRFAHDDATIRFLRSSRFECVIVGGLLPCGRSVFPESLTLEAMMEQGEQNSYVFSCQIMLWPRVEDQALKREWLRYLRYTDIRAAELSGRLATRRVILTDCTASGAETSDNVAVIPVVIDSEGRKTAVQAVRERMEPSAFVALICSLWDRWKPEFVVRQKTMLETTLQSFFREENRRRIDAGKDAVRFYDYSLGKREKKGRITASIQPRLQRGELLLDPDMSNLDEIEGEILSHPNSNEDDFLDALAMLDDPVVSRVPARPETAEKVPTHADYARESAAAASDGLENEERHARAAMAYAAMKGTQGKGRERVPGRFGV